MAEERVLHRERVYQGTVVSLRRDTVSLPRRGETVAALREVVEHAPSVVVLPVDREGNLILVRQYRLPAGEDLLEAPAGSVHPGEVPEETARRELEEETGYRAERLLPLGGFWTTPGFCTEFMHAFLATDLQRGNAHPEEDEEIQVVPVPLGRVGEWVRQGRLRDAKTLGALLLALVRAPKEVPGLARGL